MCVCYAFSHHEHQHSEADRDARCFFFALCAVVWSIVIAFGRVDSACSTWSGCCCYSGGWWCGWFTPPLVREWVCVCRKSVIHTQRSIQSRTERQTISGNCAAAASKNSALLNVFCLYGRTANRRPRRHWHAKFCSTSIASAANKHTSVKSVGLRMCHVHTSIFKHTHENTPNPNGHSFFSPSRAQCKHNAHNIRFGWSLVRLALQSHS